MRIGIIGYGEVGTIFAAGLKQSVNSISAWDTKFSSPNQSIAQRKHAESNQVYLCQSIQEVAQRADIIFSMVTASNTLAVAQAAAEVIAAGVIFIDLNSASPKTKQQAAICIESAGGSYIEAGVMTSVPPYGIRVPILLGGARSVELSTVLNKLGMDTKSVATDIGTASAIKMCRSVMIKGLEALVIESFTTARHYGVEQHMIATLKETFPSINWEQQSAYFFSRVAQHGKRRAEEMREVTNTVNEAGFAPLMAAAIAEKDDWMAQHKQAGTFDAIAAGADWQEFADRLIANNRVGLDSK